MTHKTEPARQAAFLIIHKARGRREKRVGVSAGRRRNVSAYRRIGVVGVSAYRRGRVALLRVRRSTSKERATNL
jgi:hypothetical protein